MELQLNVSADIKKVCPFFCGMAISAVVKNTSSSANLWMDISKKTAEIRSTFSIETIKEQTAIRATRALYKALGKDPTRYRPSGEALMRRVLQGKDLYPVDTVVDLINLASMTYGYSIGGFDADKLVGNSLTLGVGRAGEPYEGIGRGHLNIEFMPVYRDAIGGVGTPTSDNERTKITLQTERILVIINGYDGKSEKVLACANYIVSLFRLYASSQEVCKVTF
ncbi:MAG: phenylalanine--tRNA ligase beta subunit-related protein [Bacteroidaceae bacterium]